MDEEQMELMRVLLYNAIVTELRTPYKPQGYNGEPKIVAKSADSTVQR